MKAPVIQHAKSGLNAVLNYAGDTLESKGRAGRAEHVIDLGRTVANYAPVLGKVLGILGTG